MGRIFPKVYFLMHCSNLNASKCGFPLWGLVRQWHTLFVFQHINHVSIPPSWELRHHHCPHSGIQVALPPWLLRGDNIKGGWKHSLPLKDAFVKECCKAVCSPLFQNPCYCFSQLTWYFLLSASFSMWRKTIWLCSFLPCAFCFQRLYSYLHLHHPFLTLESLISNKM